MTKTHCFIPLILYLAVNIGGCRKTSVLPIDQLPAATTSGANTFGCLINGKVFVPSTHGMFAHAKISDDFSPLRLTVTAMYEDQNGIYTVVGLQTDSVLLIGSGQTVPFKTPGPGSAAAALNDYITNDTSTGSLTISRLDLTSHIISGTFDFQIQDPSGKTIKVTDGRFDLHYPLP
jgi:hypothetical protein